jgi:hypothetical protein
MRYINTSSNTAVDKKEEIKMMDNSFVVVKNMKANEALRVAISNENVLETERMIAYAHLLGRRDVEYTFDKRGGVKEDLQEFVDKFIPVSKKAGMKYKCIGILKDEVVVEKVNNIKEEVKKEAAAKLVDGLTAGQSEALEAMRSGKNVFLSGGAGAGKSFLIKKYIKEVVSRRGRKSVAICAPTGIAALHIEGVTLHSFFKLGIGIAEGTADTSNLEKVSVLIIDEISMVRADIFTAVMKAVWMESKKHHIQVILCGDFAQLAPVVSRNEQAEFNRRFPGNPEGLAFKTKAWETMGFEKHLLTEIVRQKNPEYAAALNDIRFGGSDGVKYIQEHCAKVPVADAVTLCGFKKTAAAINARELSKLSGQEKTFFANSDGIVKETDRVVPEELTLKVGARVILMTNINDAGLKNGQFGTVVGFSRDGVTVDFDDAGRCGIGINEWEICGYKNGSRVTIGSYKQIPLALGYAITIHKSQGQTYKSGNIYAQNLWAAGQMYVALSRFETVENVYIDNLSAPKTNSDVLAFYGKAPVTSQPARNFSSNSNASTSTRRSSRYSQYAVSAAF